MPIPTQITIAPRGVSWHGDRLHNDELGSLVKTVEGKPIAWLLEWFQGASEGVPELCQHIVYATPTGPYMGCATPITDKDTLDKLLLLPRVTQESITFKNS